MIKEAFIKFNEGREDLITDGLIALSLILIYFLIKQLIAAIRNYCMKRKTTYLDNFDVLFEVHIRRRFPSQTVECMSCLKTGVRTALRDASSRRPAVLLLLHTQQTKDTAYSLATRLIRVCLAAMDRHQPAGYVDKYLTVEGSEYSSLSDFWLFYSAMKERIVSSKTVIVRSLQAVHPHACTLVSSLTHEQFSPESQAIVVLLLEMNWFTPRPSDSAARLAESWIEQWFGHALEEAARQDLTATVCQRAVIIRHEPSLPIDK